MIEKFPPIYSSKGSLVIESFQIALRQAPSSGLPPASVIMTVPRDEFYSCAIQYKGLRAARLLHELESQAEGRCSILRIELLAVTLPEYIDTMYGGGRWTENCNHPHPFRKVEVCPL